MTERNDTPSIREIAALTARLRELSAAGRDADPAERAAFLADKDALLARIEDTTHTPGTARSVAVQTNAEEVLGRAAAGGYAMVGPSARTWSVDPATGVPVGPVSEDEHRLVRDLISHERLDGADPAWLRCDDGTDEIVALIIPGLADLDEDVDNEDVDDDRWFVDGYDDAHTAYLDALGHVDAEPLAEEQSGAPSATDLGSVAALDALASADGRLLPPWSGGTMPAAMLDGIEERLTAPAEADDPAELESRLAALRGRVGGRKPTSDEARADELNRWAQDDRSPDDVDDSGRGW